MTRVLVVHHDPDMADQEADSLRRLGYTPIQCAGPSYWSCPILAGEPCPAVTDADVLVYDVWSTGSSESGKVLIEELRELHPDIPLVVVDQGMALNWVETEGVHNVTPVTGAPTGERLAAAIEEALAKAAGRPAAASPPPGN
jgi:DNA-binding NtrC family response regulator